MMKKLLIITSKSEITASWKERETYIKQFVSGLESRLKELKVYYTSYQDLEYLVKEGSVSIYDRFNKQDLKEVQLVHFKNWVYEPQETALIANYLEWHGVNYINSEAKHDFITSKVCQMVMLAKNGVKVPDTFYSHRPHLVEALRTGRLEGFSFPLIIKANDGSMGDDNFLVESPEAAIEVLSGYEGTDKQFIVQNYLPNDGDYRLLYMGSKLEPLVFKRTARQGSHLNNTSKGGSGEFVPPNELPADALIYAKKATNVLKREVGGVDIIIDKRTNIPYVLEVNSTPALATGYGVEEKLERFSEFLKGTMGS